MRIPDAKPKVLIVDDDPLFHEDVTVLLGSRFKIDNAFSSQDALKMLKGKAYDLVILDLAIPCFLAEKDEQEGLAIYSWLRGEGIKSRIAIVSGRPGLIADAEAEVNQCTHVYTKPLGEKDILDIVEFAGGGL